MVLAVAWAVYLIPKALKHHDEVARTRSIDRFSTAMRVLARREPTGSGRGSSGRLVVTPARPTDHRQVLVPVTAAAAVDRPTPAQRAAARAAARRRRRILTFLLLCTAVVLALAGFGVSPWWSAAVPATLVLSYLVLCRTQVRRARDKRWRAGLVQAIADEAPAQQGGSGTPRRAARVEAPYGTPLAPAVRNAQGFVEVDADDDTVTIPAVVDAMVVPTADAGSLWDPLPVTLPTYVSKPKAHRTVRTIDLGAPGTWTSGRTAEDAEIAAEAAAHAAPGSGAAEDAVEAPRAVGS